MRNLLALILAAGLLTAANCAPDQAFVRGMDNYYKAVAPEYKKYVIDRQPVPEWTDEEKEIREDSLKGWKALIKEAEDDE